MIVLAVVSLLAIGALVGQVMKATRGQADPRKTNELLREVIG